MHMVKRWLTTHAVWQTRIYLEFTVKIQHAHGQKMIDPLSVTDQDLTENFTVNIQHAHGQKMIDSPCSMTDQDLT